MYVTLAVRSYVMHNGPRLKGKTLHLKEGFLCIECSKHRSALQNHTVKKEQKKKCVSAQGNMTTSACVSGGFMFNG